MSTRSGIWYQDETDTHMGIHLFYEYALEGQPVCLEIMRGPFLLEITLPKELIKAIKGLP
jgi:hypothetical protein